jgi:hypothetical protein
MTPARMRTMYVLMGLTLLMLAGTLFVLTKVQDVRDNQQDAVVLSRAACVRNNTVRDAEYFLLTERVNDARIIGSEASAVKIRRRFVGQLTRTLAKREAFVAQTGEFAEPAKPWLVNCAAAWPDP